MTKFVERDATRFADASTAGQRQRQQQRPRPPAVGPSAAAVPLDAEARPGQARLGPSRPLRARWGMLPEHRPPPAAVEAAVDDG
jgi:hypothetical protein